MSLIVRCGGIMKDEDVEWPLEEHMDGDPLKFIEENFPDAHLFNFIKGDDCLEWIAEPNCDKIKEMIGLRDFDIMNDYKGNYWRTLYINNTKSFNLEKCISLTSLENVPTNITELNLNGCESLTSLEHCPQSVTELDLSLCKSLTSLKYCPPNITELRLFLCISLESLEYCPMGIIKLNLSWCVSLRSLEYCAPEIRKLNLEGCASLISLEHKPERATIINVPNHLKLNKK